MLGFLILKKKKKKKVVETKQSRLSVESLTLSRLSVSVHPESSPRLSQCQAPVSEGKENQPHTSPDLALPLKRPEAASTENSLCSQAGHKGDVSQKSFKSFSVKKQDIHIVPEN